MRPTLALLVSCISFPITQGCEGTGRCDCPDTCEEENPCLGAGIYDQSGRVPWTWIEGGQYTMNYRYAPLSREVSLPGFLLATTETTMDQYKACVDAECCDPPDKHYPCFWDQWLGSENSITGSHPVDCTTWTQVKSFCKWVGARLPTEAEWEYAARNRGKEQLFPWGDAQLTCEYAVTRASDDRDKGCGRIAPWEVCSKPPGHSEQGICDLIGNMSEWVEDDYHQDYEGTPTDGSARIDHPRAAKRVIRGGGWAGGGSTVSRGRWEFDDGQVDIGFRCAR